MKLLASQLDEARKVWVMALAETVMPILHGKEWEVLDTFANGLRAVSPDGLKVISEVEMVTRGVAEIEPWLHVSFSREDRMPSYEDMKRIKLRFVGRRRKAIMVLPAEAEHFNHHPFCLHFYSPLHHDPLPDFRAEGGAL